MFKTRNKKLEEDAKKEGLTPTSELKVDESGLEPEQKGHIELPLAFIIIAGIIVIAMIVFAIVIITSGGPVSAASHGSVNGTTGSSQTFLV